MHLVGFIIRIYHDARSAERHKHSDIDTLLCSDRNFNTFCLTCRIRTQRDVLDWNKIKAMHYLIPSKRKNKMSVTIIRKKCRIFCSFLFVKLDAILNRTIPSTLNLFQMSVAVVTRYILKASPKYLGTAVAQWLRCCATNRNVAGSIPAGVTGIFH